MTWRYIISEDGERVSLGRLAFWLIFMLCVGKYWLLGVDIPLYLFWSWSTLVAYNVLKKPLGIAREFFSKDLTKN
jgi:hypothetical protein